LISAQAAHLRFEERHSGVDMKSMQIMQFAEPLQLMTQDLPALKGDEVLISVKRCGMCHTDLHIWHGYYDLGGGKRLTLSERGVNPPVTPGHEIYGEIVEVGPTGRSADIGKSGVVFPWIGCGECVACRADEEHLCSDPRSLGVFRPGGYCDYLILPNPHYVIDSGELDPAIAATYACSGLTAYSALRKVEERRPGDWLGLIGAGGVGLAGLSIAQAMGFDKLAIFDTDPAKRQAASIGGATRVVDPRSHDDVTALVETANGGLSAVIDFVGTAETFKLGMEVLRKGGRYVLVGLFGGEVQIQLPLVPLRAQAILGSYIGSLQEMHDLMALVKRRQPAPVPVQTRPLAEANEALQALAAGEVVGRIVLVP
jgi:D-arabinose 1-dehydrogenase-like Zn-dependent alcohol dehydrogenase